MCLREQVLRPYGTSARLLSAYVCLCAFPLRWASCYYLRQQLRAGQCVLQQRQVLPKLSRMSLLQHWPVACRTSTHLLP